jgi:uncharacterized short protein YbdD (DUF466 family)
MRAHWHAGKKLLCQIWHGVRECCGDAAYDRYLRSHAQRNLPPRYKLSAEEFYVEQLHRRYSRPNRCC